MSQACADVARKLAESFQAGNLEEALNCVHPKGVVTEPLSLWYGGSHIGPAGFRDVIEAMHSKLDIELVSYEVFDSPTRTVMQTQMRFTSKANGRTLEIPCVQLYKEQDGKLIELDIYYKDTAALLALVGLWAAVDPAPY